jgi:hypothetical protein
MSSRPAKPSCKLIGERLLDHRARAAGTDSSRSGRPRAREFVEKAFRSGSDDPVLQLCLEYVEVV